MTVNNGRGFQPEIQICVVEITSIITYSKSLNVSVNGRYEQKIRGYPPHSGWRLSPAYDLNPVPVDIRPHILSTAIDLDDPTASIDLALETADYYDLKASDAKHIVVNVANAVSGRRTEAARFGVTAREIDRMASAFEHEDLEKLSRNPSPRGRGAGVREVFQPLGSIRVKP